MAEPSLIFVGGVSGTEKTKIIERACAGRPYETIRISEHYLEAIGKAPGSDPNDLRGLEWKRFEEDAIERLCTALEPLLRTSTQAILINTHFASRSQRGFMSGTDAEGIREICKAMRLLLEESKGRAGVILLDSTPQVVLADSGPQLPTLNVQRDVEADLNNNRLLSKDYYHSLVGFLGHKRVRYASILVGSDKKLNAEEIRDGVSALRKHIEAVVALDIS